MFPRFTLAVAVFLALSSAAEARRVALVIGQDAYPGGSSATIGLPTLDNSGPDARSVAALLQKHGFEVISCDGKEPGCLDLKREQLIDALAKLETRAHGADLALAYFAGHGMATEQGNILAPTDAHVDCTTGEVMLGVPVERIMAATAPAQHKFLILDACRDNPLKLVCPNLKGKKLSFSRIEAGAMQGLLLVTSTQFGQQALDGLAGTHSPFATALLAALQAAPNVYFEQVMNEVARGTYEAAQKQGGFLQIPGKVVGGAAPADCLAGKDCVGDPRMAALSAANEQLAGDASGIRTILASEEAARGKPYAAEERKKRLADLQATLANIGQSTDPLRQEARQLIDAGNVTDGEAKLDEALGADEKALGEAERVASEKRKAAAQSARDLAVLAKGRDVLKAAAYYKRATVLDPGDAETWRNYAGIAMDVGRLTEAKAAFEQAAKMAQAAGDTFQHYWAVLGQGDVAIAQGDLPIALTAYRASLAIHEMLPKSDPDNAGWQRDHSVAQERIGDVLVAQGNLPTALDAYRAGLAIAEWLAKSDPGNAGWQRDLSVAQEKIGNVLVAQGNLLAALDAYRASLAIRERLARSDPGNAGWQRDLAVSQNNIGNVLVAQGNLPTALDAYRAGLAIAEKLARSDPGNAGWQRDLSVAQERIGDVLVAQGNLLAALDAYRAGLAIAETLAKSDPGNAGWQRDLSMSQEKIGNVLVAQGNLPTALDAHRAGLAIAEKLARSDPGNAGWQRDLSVAQDNIGNVLVVQGNLPTALDAYRAGLAIAETLAKSDPGNAGWQRDLSVAQEKIGNVLVAQGNLPAALDAYRAGLAIAETLTKSDPTNAGWQRDRAVSHSKVATALARQGKRDAARADFQAGRDIIVRLTRASPDDATLPKDLAEFDEEIAKLDK